MASKIALLFVLSVAYIRSEDDCVCNTPEQLKDDQAAVFNFLKELESDPYFKENGAIPFILSPLVPCGNCLEGARKKRTVISTEPKTDSGTEEDFDYFSLVNNDPKCPEGYARILTRCIDLRQQLFS